ncbi:hypothetical protein SAMN05444161_8494 [Rhizobiales bacterium GAS191]|nr:hypothetical protein SAMN05444161_8494 [Rhizobiales bacterium GAS191]
MVVICHHNRASAQTASVHVTLPLKAAKTTGADSISSVARSDIFGGKVIPFVPLSGGHQS